MKFCKICREKINLKECHTCNKIYHNKPLFQFKKLILKNYKENLHKIKKRILYNLKNISVESPKNTKIYKKWRKFKELQTKEFNNRKYLKISIEIPILQISNEIN